MHLFLSLSREHRHCCIRRPEDGVSYLIVLMIFSLCVYVYSVRPSETSVSTPTFFPLDSLQKKLKDLEEENKTLRSEVNILFIHICANELLFL